MKLDSTIENLFKKATSYLIRKQRKDGSWKGYAIQHKEPSVLQKEIVTTAEGVLALNISADFSDDSAFDSINSGLFYCINFDLGEKDPIEWWAFKLYALRNTNIPLAQKEIKKIRKHIASTQSKDGFWPTFPSTFNLLNNIAIRALMGSEYNDVLQKSASWFKRSMAKDGVGWGIDDKSEKSEVTFTSNVITSLVISGVDPSEKFIQKSKKFLEEKQYKNGGWPSSRFTVHKPTIYSTAITLETLMLISDNPFSNVIKKGISFLVKNSYKGGGWPLLPGEKPEIYTTYFAINTLYFYDFLRQRWNDEDVVFLRKFTKPQHITSYLYREFDLHLRRRFAERNFYQIAGSRSLGSTISAIKRRRRIISILANEGPKDVSEVIDSLRKIKDYSYLNKKAHMTQIKLDLEYLRSIRIIHKKGHKYFVFYIPLKV